MPRTLTKVDICEKSGELATDRCFEMVAGEKHRTTFTTYATAAEKPTQYCQVHGGGTFLSRRARGDAVGAARSGERGRRPPMPRWAAKRWRRPWRSSTLSAVKPVVVRSQTVVEEAGKDPYDLLQPAVATSATGELLAAGGGTEQKKAPEDGSSKPAGGTGEKEVRRAVPVSPAETQDAPAIPVKVDPPAPLDFN